MSGRCPNCGMHFIDCECTPADKAAIEQIETSDAQLGELIKINKKMNEIIKLLEEHK